MKVLAVGATGKFAGLVVPALARSGVEVRALVHNPAKAETAIAGAAVKPSLCARPAPTLRPG
ncbi:MAG: NmrA family NAD(P)-binding protein [Nocardioidaceae bacterium]